MEALSSTKRWSRQRWTRTTWWDGTQSRATCEWDEGHEPYAEMKHEGTDHEGHGAAGGRTRKPSCPYAWRFQKEIYCFSVTFPVLLLSPTIQDFFQLWASRAGLDYSPLIFLSVYFYGGTISQGDKEELPKSRPNDDPNSHCTVWLIFTALPYWTHGEVFSGACDPYRCNAQALAWDASVMGASRAPFKDHAFSRPPEKNETLSMWRLTS